MGATLFKIYLSSEIRKKKKLLFDIDIYLYTCVCMWTILMEFICESKMSMGRCTLRVVSISGPLQCCTRVGDQRERHKFVPSLDYNIDTTPLPLEGFHSPQVL